MFPHLSNDSKEQVYSLPEVSFPVHLAELSPEYHRSLFTIKNELNVASHRENLVIAPDLSETVQVSSLISAIPPTPTGMREEVHKTHDRNAM